MRCPVCDSDSLVSFLERDAVPVFQNLPFATRDEARAVGRGALRLACCAGCGFITNTAFDESLVRYAEGYVNDQAHSQVFSEHVDRLVDRLVEGGVRGARVVEVGCGQGAFLERLCARGANTGVGFDPAYVGPPQRGPSLRFVADYYGAAHADVAPDFVVCRHVVEHVARPLDLLGAIGAALRGRSGARVALETPDVAWIFDRRVMYDLFYEHCSYFTADALAVALRLRGFAPERSERLFGGQYLWLEARHVGGVSADAAGRDGARVLRSAEAYARHERAELARLRGWLEALRETGPVAVWGAGAKGVTFVNLLDPAAELVACVVDINPGKQRRFVAGTGHAIVAPSELAARSVAHVVVMNPNYAAEIAAALAGLGASVSVHTEAPE